MITPTDLEINLKRTNYDPEACCAAIRGEKIPGALGLKVTQNCVIRGIRYNFGYGRELYSYSDKFARAINARDIMSDRIPEMKTPSEIPYCIWFPQVASEDTYRQLACRYPSMKYQIGRACAVAGYNDLYHQLGLLPEVHIAEEARDAGSMEIFNSILEADTKYDIMDDYRLHGTLSENRLPNKGHLNGDTAVRSTLELKAKFRGPKDPVGPTVSQRKPYFDITEDEGVGEHSSETQNVADNDLIKSLLYTPLPADLPTVHKDLLILMAAYNGDVDRYARLRRPEALEWETECVVRGIYHSPLFAKWWSLEQNKAKDTFDPVYTQAINARFIMSNDISRIKPETPDCELPYCIWYPAIAHPFTYLELWRRKPVMQPSIARACIVADYPQIYDKINPQADKYLIAEAEVSSNQHYKQDLETKATVSEKLDGHAAHWKVWITRNKMFEPSTLFLHRIMMDLRPDPEGMPLYNGRGGDMSQIELSALAPDELKTGDHVNLGDIYEPWVPRS